MRPLPRATVARRPIARSARPVLRRNDLSLFPAPAAAGFQSDPYLDYGRFLTPQGGILITYKDIDTRLRHILWRVLAWTVATGPEAWFLLHHSPVHAPWINDLCLFAVAGLNLLILWKLPEVHRSIEIRPDCMIVEGADVFWLARMETSWPAFHPDKKGNQVLSGIYGTRFVEYLTVRRFDDYDRTPEVFAAHLQEAMMQLWAPPAESGGRHDGTRRG